MSRDPGLEQTIALNFRQEINKGKKQEVKMITVKKLLLLLTLFFYAGTAYSDITWSAPTAISTALTNASDPHTVIDSNNNITAAWVENGLIKTASLPSGGSWSSPITLSNVSNTASFPRLGVDSTGNVTAIWIENTQVVSASRPFGGSWSSSTTISVPGVTSFVFVVDNSGHAVAVWQRSGSIESSTKISGSWSLVAVLSASNSSNPHVAISSFGTAMAVWHATSSGNDILTTNTLTLSTNTWGTTKNVFTATATFMHNYPKIALDSNGNAIVAWFRYNKVNTAYENVQVIVSSLNVGASNWQIPQLVSNPGIRNPADLTIKLKFDADGNAMLVWINSYDGQNFVVESSQKLFGASLWPFFASPQIPTLYSIGIDLQNVSGNVLLTSMAWDGSSMNILSQQTSSGQPNQQNWTIEQTVSTGDDNAYPSSAFSRTGNTLNAVAVWVHFDGSNTVIHAAIGTDTAIGVPGSVSASQSSTGFGVYTDYVNTITWSASSNPDIMQYNIFRNGVFIFGTDASTFSFADHNQIQNGTNVYGVAAMTSSYRQSDIVTYTIFP